MQNVKELAKIFTALEGRFSDDPDDLGGVTKYGVTLATLERLGMDITQDGRSDLVCIPHTRTRTYAWIAVVASWSCCKVQFWRAATRKRAGLSKKYSLCNGICA